MSLRLPPPQSLSADVLTRDLSTGTTTEGENHKQDTGPEPLPSSVMPFQQVFPLAASRGQDLRQNPRNLGVRWVML